MATVEIDSPLTGSQVQTSFNATGWASMTGSGVISCSYSVNGGAPTSMGQVTVANGIWTTPSANAVAGAKVSVTASVSDTGGPDSDTTDDITVDAAINDATNPLPINITTVQLTTKKTAAGNRTLSVGGQFSKKTLTGTPAAVTVAVVVFHGKKKKSEVFSVTAATLKTTVTPCTWSAMVVAPPPASGQRQVLTAYVEDKTGVVLGLATSKLT
jgi:hypothetical protein